MSDLLRFGRHLPAALSYELLAHLDLGADAANLYDPGRPRKPWVPQLLDAYQAAPGRLALHFVGLYGGDVGDLLARLRGGRVLPLNDAPGRHLADAFAAAVEFEREPYERAFVKDAPGHATRVRAVASLATPLAAVRAALWSRVGEEPPPLSVLDCPALSHRGRGMTFRDGTRAIATSLAEAPEHLFCQILHEETHPVSDRSSGPTPDRDTRAGTPGHDDHLRLEAAAVALGAAVVDEAVPAWRDAYERWRTRYGL